MGGAKVMKTPTPRTCGAIEMEAATPKTCGAMAIMTTKKSKYAQQTALVKMPPKAGARVSKSTPRAEARVSQSISTEKAIWIATLKIFGAKILFSCPQPAIRRFEENRQFLEMKNKAIRSNLRSFKCLG